MKTNETMTPEDVERDVEATGSGISPLAIENLETVKAARAALSRLATAAARVPGLENKAEELEKVAALYEADRYECHRVLSWAGMWGRPRAEKPSRHVMAILERLMSAEAERDAARQEAHREQARADDATARATHFEMEAKRLKANFTTTCRQLDEAKEEVEVAREEFRAMRHERDEWKKQAEAQEALVEGWSDALGLEKTAGYDEAEAIREERDALTARVAELEARATERREHLLELQDAKSAAEARATAAEAKVMRLEDELSSCRLDLSAIQDERDTYETAADHLSAMVPAPTPAPGLREAVGPVLKALEGYSIALAQEGGDSRAIPVWLSKAEARALLAAYDATPPAVTHAALAAVVEEVADEAGMMAEAPIVAGSDTRRSYERGRAKGAREVLRRATGGEVPRVLLESRVVEVLTDVLGQREGIQRTHFMQVDMDEAEPLGNGWERAIREAGRMLGLTLPAGPGGGEPNPPESPDGSTDPEMEHISRMSDAEVDAELAKAGVDVAAFEERARAHVAKVRASLPPDSPYFKAASSPGPAQQPAPRARIPTLTPDVPPMAQPEPAAPEVEWEADWLGLRVMRSGRLLGFYKGAWHDLPEGLMNPERDWRPVVTALARALTEARRDNEAAKTILTRAARQMEQDAARKAAEDMRERCAVAGGDAAAAYDAAHGGIDAHTGPRCARVASDIRNLPLE